VGNLVNRVLRRYSAAESNPLNILGPNYRDGRHHLLFTLLGVRHLGELFACPKNPPVRAAVFLAMVAASDI
jgi:hypothetical protein